MYKIPNIKNSGEFYRVLEMTEGCNISKIGTHTAKIMYVPTGRTSEIWCVTEPTGDSYVDRYLMVKQSMEYVQDDYI